MYHGFLVLGTVILTEHIIFVSASVFINRSFGSDSLLMEMLAFAGVCFLGAIATKSGGQCA